MASQGLFELDIKKVFPNPAQPRKAFDADKLEELAMSIRHYGVLEPIVVTPREGGFMIIAGERRWRASNLAGLTSIPAKVMEADDALVEELALLENIQRQDLNVIEEAVAFKSLLERGWSKEDIAGKMGFKQVWRVDERLSLLNLADDIMPLALAGKVTNSQAFEMSRLKAPQQHIVLRKILAGELGTYNRLRSFVNGLDAMERQECIFAMQPLTPSEDVSLRSLENALKSIERFFASVDTHTLEHFKKACFHSTVSAETIDYAIQRLAKVRKAVFEGEGVKNAMSAA